jgi:hypothetical protein
MLDGDTVRAKALIAGTLAQLDPRNAPADLALIELVVLWTHLVAESKDCADPPKSVVDWAGWAVLTTRYLFGPGHRQTGRALLGLARVHAARGEHLAAAMQYQALAETCFARANPAAALLAREGAAAELHAGGQCQAGITELTAVAQDERAWLIRTPTEYRHQIAAMLAACASGAAASTASSMAPVGSMVTYRATLRSSPVEGRSMIGSTPLRVYRTPTRASTSASPASSAQLRRFTPVVTSPL